MPGGDLTLEVQLAVVERLLADPIIVSPQFLNGPNVFDHVPDQQPPNFICVAGATSNDHGDKSDPGQDELFPIRVWTREKGDKLGLKIAKRIVELFHEKALPLTAGQATLIRLKSGGSIPEGDGVSRQVYRNFRIITSEPPQE